jgi:CheY-like chemotaxis protein
VPATIDATYEVMEAENGREAIRVLTDAEERDRLPDVIILDLLLPVMDGSPAVPPSPAAPVVKARAARPVSVAS